MSILLAAALAASAPATTQEAWLECARAAIGAELASGLPSHWPRAEAVPENIPVLFAALPSSPSAEAIDAVHYILHGLPDRNAAYVYSSGGIADFRVLYGPILLNGKCVPPPQVPSNNSSKPTPLRGAA